MLSRDSFADVGFFTKTTLLLHKLPKLHTAKVFATKLAIDIKKHELVLKKIHEIMETVYADLKGKQIYRNIQQNLMEASKHYLACTKQPLTEKSLQNFHTSLENYSNLSAPSSKNSCNTK